MARYRMEDNTVVDTDKATRVWAEATDWDGRNRINRTTGSQWNSQTLYCSRKGRYYVLHTSQWQGSRDHVEYVSPEEAARWLLLNDRELPGDLKRYEEELTE